MIHCRSWDMEIMTTRPSCDIFNLRSSYSHVPLTTVRHLLNIWTFKMAAVPVRHVGYLKFDILTAGGVSRGAPKCTGVPNGQTDAET